jgi:catechol 2,3-dioxygenase-like lactoylglutathione lyase family enzyme
MTAELEENQTHGVGRRSLLQRLFTGGATLGALVSGVIGRPAAAAEGVVSIRCRNYTLSVADMQKSVRFYTEVFGFKIERPSVKVGSAIDKVVELKNVNVELQSLMKDGVRLQLACYTSPTPVDGGPRLALNRRGFTHHAFDVTDVDAVLELAKKFGGTVIEESLMTRNGKTSIAFLLDPDGTRVELVGVAA